MSNRNQQVDEGYYEDEGEFLDADPRASGEHPLAILGTSYGISALVHAAILLIMAAIIVAAPAAEQEAVVISAKHEKPDEPYDEELERDMKEVVPLEAEQKVEEPQVVTEEELEIVETPKGELDNISTKDLAMTSAVDAFGVAGGGAGVYGTRFGERGRRIAENGGTPGSTAAPEAALRWLMAHQSPGGFWDGDGWHRNCGRGEGRPTCSGPGTENAFSSYDVGLTGLALLAFLGHGEGVEVGAMRRTVRRAINWLKTQQRADGALGFDAGHGESIYNHAIATMALCEAYAVTGDSTLRDAAQRAVNFCVQTQNPGLGWRYGTRSGQNDTSVTGWMVLALKAAKVAQLDVPPSTFEGARRWFLRATASRAQGDCSRGGFLGSTGYTTPGSGSSYLQPNYEPYDEAPTMTAVSVLCRVFSGERRTERPIMAARDELLASLPSWPQDSVRPVNFYYWYYGTYAMFQLDHGRHWSTWNTAMQEALVPTQRKGGCEDGSWDPVGEWCLAGGRVYATAINALTLEIYYRFERTR
jgi:hypothetical protein